MTIKPIEFIEEGTSDLLRKLYGGEEVVPEKYKQKVLLGEVETVQEVLDKKKLITDGRQHLWLFPEQAEAARSRKENRQPNAESYYERIPAAWKKEWQGKDIDESDWRPDDVENHSAEFREFIRSHIPRFDKIIPYKPFFLYVEQARRWLSEDRSIEDFEGEEQEVFAIEELFRIKQNRLYGMNKYGWIQDDSIPGGRRKYFASTPQALLIFLLDCGYSAEVGKGRQAAITSTVMLYEVMTMLVTPSYRGVLVADDVATTATAIFNQKFKASYQYIYERQKWMCPENKGNFAAGHVTFDWSESSNKVERGLYSSSYSIASADDKQAINGQSPSKVVFDETQNIATYAAMKMEARPFMLASMEDGSIKVARQILAYGTGTSSNKGKGVFENEYKSTLAKFMRGDETSTFVPLFFDWTCRPNMTEERYQKEYKVYLTSDDVASSGATKEERLSIFHSAYPSRVEDMWLTSHSTIIPAMLIKSHLDRIYEKCYARGLAPRPGHFEPVFDMSKPMPAGSYLPYFVKDAKWVEHPMDDIDAPCLMLIDRVPKWVNRYVKGTDPTQSPNGVSKFATMVIDKAARYQELDGQKLFEPVPACLMNWKAEVVQEYFLQSALMNLYYSNHGKRGCVEVFENNQGQSYELFMGSPFLLLRDSLLYRRALPLRYQVGNQHRGVSLRTGKGGGTKGHLYTQVRNGLIEYGKNIWFDSVFTQAQNIIVEEKDGGFTYYPRNKHVDNDDILDAFGFALIALEASPAPPMEVGVDVPVKIKKIEPNHDAYGNIYWEEIEIANRW